MTTTNQNFTMYSGDTKFINVTVTGENGGPLDITGASIKWAAKKNVRSSISNISKSTSSGVEITDALTGKFQVKLNPIDTASLSGDFYHEAELTDVQGNVSTIFTGTLSITIDGI